MMRKPLWGGRDVELSMGNLDGHPVMFPAPTPSAEAKIFDFHHKKNQTKPGHSFPEKQTNL